MCGSADINEVLSPEVVMMLPRTYKCNSCGYVGQYFIEGLKGDERLDNKRDRLK